MPITEMTPEEIKAECDVDGYHRDVGEAPTAKFEARGWRVQALGGGRIKFDAQRERVQRRARHRRRRVVSAARLGGSGGTPMHIVERVGEAELRRRWPA